MLSVHVCTIYRVDYEKISANAVPAGMEPGTSHDVVLSIIVRPVSVPLCTANVERSLK